MLKQKLLNLKIKYKIFLIVISCIAVCFAQNNNNMVLYIQSSQESLPIYFPILATVCN